LGETPYVQVSTTWALTCPETVHQRLCMTREMETWLSDSRTEVHCVIVSCLTVCNGVEMQAVEVLAQDLDA